MGFDLCGVGAKTERGEYFRNNCWWWRPLWSYVCDVCSKFLTEKDLESGSYNDGHLITAEQAMRIAVRLEHLVNQGEVKKYEKKYKKALEELPDVKCNICDGTGKRNDEIVQGKCNACNGTGAKRPWSTSYPFSEENVKEFIEFCRESGGFQIW